MKKIKSINIITSPFCCIPPHAIGAVEKLWKSCGDYYKEKGIYVTFISKRPGVEDIRNNESCRYIKGYDWTGHKLLDLVLDLAYSWKALRRMPACDAVVLNTIWSPILLPLFRKKYRVSLYNVARFPKKQLGWYRAVDILSCVSNIVYETMVAQSPITAKQGCVISNFINTDLFRKRREHSLSNHPVVLYTGRIHREKGLDLLVRAINMVRKDHNVSLRIIGAWETQKGGSGPEYKRELDSLAVNWNIEWVNPIYSPEKLAEEMDKCDLYCYPSMADKGETFGVAPLEAMGLGLPTIVSSLGCFKDFLTDNITGLVFDHHAPNAKEQLAQCITKIVSNHEMYSFLSANGIVASKRFNIVNKAEEYLTVLTNYINHGQTGFDRESMKVKMISGKCDGRQTIQEE